MIRVVKKLLTLLLLIGAGLVGIVFWLNLPRNRPASEKIFTYSRVEKGTMIDTISATGVVQIEPYRIMLISSEVPGTVVAVPCKVNDRVPEGATLVKLDDRQIRLKWEESENGLKSAQAGLAQAEAALAQAEAMQKAAQLGLRYQVEIEKKGGFRSERDQAEMKVKAALAGVEAAGAGVKLARTKLEAAGIANREAQLVLEKTRIRVPVAQKALARAAAIISPPLSPATQTEVVHTSSAAWEKSRSDGVRADFLILECNVKIGQQVGPSSSTPLFMLARDLERMEVHAQVAEGDIGRVKKGLIATFTVTAFSDENIEFRGRVKQIHPMPSSLKGAIYYDTVIEVENQKEPETAEWRLRPGMTAAVDIIRREHKNVWKMPTPALNFQMEEAYQSAAARDRVAEWKDRPEWRPVWIWDGERGEPWPVLIRIGGQDKNGEPGLKDGGFNEVLEWEPGREPAGDSFPRVIIDAPQAHSPGFFDRPANIKVS
jgi:HlyD family secretion protein